MSDVPASRAVCAAHRALTRAIAGAAIRDRRLTRGRRAPGKGWSTALARPIGVRGAGELCTLADAREMILETLSDGMQRRPEWQNAAGKLMAAAETGTRDDIEAATLQVERALFMAARLVMG